MKPFKSSEGVWVQLITAFPEIGFTSMSVITGGSGAKMLLMLTGAWFEMCWQAKPAGPTDVTRNFKSSEHASIE